MAFILVKHHIASPQSGLYIIKADNAGKVNIVRGFKIMAAASRAKSDCIATTQIQRTGKRFAIKQNIDPVKRAHPAEFTATPSLAFWPWKMGQNINNDRRQQRGRITAGDFAS